MKIYTKTGDKGKTSLIDNQRVYKDNIRVEAYGTADELNAHIALLACIINHDKCKKNLQNIEKMLFIVQTHLAIADRTKCNFPIVEFPSDMLKKIEEEIDWLQMQISKNKAFVMLDAHQVVAQCHIARTVCRRLERRLISLAKKTNVEKEILMYINRLSDYLFVLARFMANWFQVEEIEVNLRE